MTQPILSSFALVAASEMGDKTQLLAFSLAARFKKPWIVIAGIFVATILNHALAASVGQWVSDLITPETLAIVLGITFIGFGLWALKPDSLEEEEQKNVSFGPFITTVTLFFLAEMGDKTQFATIALGARYNSILLVTLGTTLGMMATNSLAVFLGEKIAHRVQAKCIRGFAALLFLAFGLMSLWKAFF